MKNLYQKFDERKQYVTSFYDTIEGDYEILFLGKFMPTIIDYFIQNTKIEDLDLSFRIYFKKRNHNSKPEMEIKGKCIYFSINEYRYYTLVGNIIDFFKELPGGIKWLDETEQHYDGIEANTTLLDLLNTYKKNLPKVYNQEKLASQSEKAEAATESLENLLADEVHAKIFEEKFLDKYVVNLIEDSIEAITHRNNVEKAENNYPVYRTININFASNVERIIYMDDNYTQAFGNIVKYFMEFYGLGTVEEMNGFQKIRFATTLDKLMDAYYMEKQRIEYYTSGAYQETANQNTK